MALMFMINTGNDDNEEAEVLTIDTVWVRHGWFVWVRHDRFWFVMSVADESVLFWLVMDSSSCGLRVFWSEMSVPEV